MSELTAQQKREYVEEHVPGVKISEGAYASVVYFETGIADIERSTRAIGQGHNYQEAWHAAYLFTLERVEEIRQVEAEIAVLMDHIPSIYAKAWERDKNEWSRIIARLQAALAELKRGMTAGG
jgi:hypothetical protein